MPLFRKPSAAEVTAFLAAQADAPFSYPAVGATAGTPPPGYTVDHTRVRLGYGPGVFQAAMASLGRWDQFRLGWVEAVPTVSPIRVGTTVAVVARVLGLWWLNACRIVYVVDGDRSFGFAYGTLPGHAESGEERFLVEWDPADDAVWYDILAFSRPRHPLARLGYPLTRRTQKRFARDSAAAITPRSL
jgi:uncharacterized protein (UPF0548 family)